ncbi:uncharacterized protein LOC114526566 [Dendronephthya gigantea]|uniref:uncharacterized protein LOC114526566 n=1 Tax=Dendronephthya gigantea TaxID=151771 RepID=UPI001069AD7A|nr:uncharacterized protein LOC114526566 [Dendronephthya gigantea]
MPHVKRCIKTLVLKSVNEQCKNLCVKTKGIPSVMRVTRKSQRDLKSFKWIDVLRELKDRSPDILEFLLTIAVPSKLKCTWQQIPPVCTAFGILMNQRCRELSLIQKINTVILGSSNATKKTFQRFNKLGITQTRKSFVNLMDDVGGNLIDDLKKFVSNEGEMRIVFDNFDFKVLANIILRNHCNSDMHWIGHYVTFDRIPSDHLDDTKPLVSDINKFKKMNYLLNEDELQMMNSDFTTLVTRVLVEYIPCLQHLNSSVCQHIPHKNIAGHNNYILMAKQSVVVGLPIVPFNQSKHSDVCQYLDYVEDLLAKIFGNDEYSTCLPSQKAAKKNDIVKQVKVPLCGDLLGCERVTGAKKTRLGCDNESERFENIIENAAQWHPKQSFLALIWKQLYKATGSCGREVGTLYNLQQQFNMVNVYTKVKKNYRSAEHLMLSATKAYICCAFMQWCGMKRLEDTPQGISIPTKDDTNEVIEAFIRETIGSFVKEYVLVEFDTEKKLRHQLQAVKDKRKNANELQTPDSQTVNGGGLYIATFVPGM